MASDGSKLPVSNLQVDQAKLAEFTNSKAGSAFAGVYDPANSYYQQGSNIYATTGKVPDISKLDPSKAGMTDATGFMAAYNAWLSGNQQTQQSWDNYAKLVNANRGGEGDNTITTGAAMGQRNALLGALNGPLTSPTPGMGAMGMAPKTLGRLK